MTAIVHGRHVGGGVAGEIGGGHGVAIAKESRQLGACDRRADECAERAERQRQLDVVRERARLRAVGVRAMQVRPARERAREQHVAELAALHVVAMLDDPACGHREPDERVEPRQRRGRDRRIELDARAVGDAAVAAHDADALPRRREALEGAGTLVPREERVGGDGNVEGSSEAHPRPTSGPATGFRLSRRARRRRRRGTARGTTPPSCATAPTARRSPAPRAASRARAARTRAGWRFCTPRSSSGSTSGRPRRNMRNICAVQRPTPFTRESAAMAASSSSASIVVERHVVRARRARRGRAGSRSSAARDRRHAAARRTSRAAPRARGRDHRRARGSGDGWCRPPCRRAAGRRWSARRPRSASPPRAPRRRTARRRATTASITGSERAEVSDGARRRACAQR